MLSRFQSFLKEEFKGLPNTDEVTDFKDELLGNLMDKAEELKAKDLSEDEIFQQCVQSIDGYKETLKELKGKPALVRSAKKAANSLLYALMYFTLVIGAYLAVSFVTEEWRLTWLIIVEGAFLFTVGLLGSLSVKAFAKKKYLHSRALAVPISAILVTGVFLAVSMLMDLWKISWIAYLFLPILIIIVDLIIGAFSRPNKIIVPESIALIMLLSVMSYVVLGILGILSWHPYWLIILGGALISLGILAFYLKKKL
ncbi:MAG: hypothetical protein QM214_07190 [Bacillota bacterium]|jgi:hypothetical protein|nr:hypothetical protein [Bacillota bacterium]HHU43500.1 hypothetical protein [Clostridiales bacterium]